MKLIYKSKRKCWRYGNCVFYSRRKAKKYGTYLPYGLVWLWNKKRIINSKTPKKGRVAIMKVGRYGHVGLVYKVKGDKIYIREANYYSCRKSKRKGTKREFKILGYYKQKK